MGSLGLFEPNTLSREDAASGRGRGVTVVPVAKKADPKPRIIAMSNWYVKPTAKPEESFQWKSKSRVVFDYSEIASQSEPMDGIETKVAEKESPAPVTNDSVDIQLDDLMGKLMQRIYDLQRRKHSAVYFEERQNAALELIIIKNNLSLLIG